jgi:hypothetical protein
MMKIGRTILLASFILFHAFLAACSSEVNIRTQLLEKTPIGVQFDEVLQFCKSKDLKCTISTSSGFLNQRTGKVVGVKSIRTIYSEKRELPFFFTTTISVEWGFDENGKLLDFWVWKTSDGL